MAHNFRPKWAGRSSPTGVLSSFYGPGKKRDFVRREIFFSGQRSGFYGYWDINTFRQWVHCQKCKLASKFTTYKNFVSCSSLSLSPSLSNSFIHTYTHSLFPSLSPSLSLIHTHTLSLPLTRSLTLFLLVTSAAKLSVRAIAHSHSPSLSLALTLLLSHSHSLSLSV